MGQQTIAIIGVGGAAILAGIIATVIIVTMLINMQGQIRDLSAELRRTNEVVIALADHIPSAGETPTLMPAR